ncbi:hypothetical protein [Nocardioides sp. GXQ0305]|uniref:hypothetical protein n=1 Tax=Nocardioides sp. GXQ0305 TaxID=3423912 RepID=UPI003D7DEFBE
MSQRTDIGVRVLMLVVATAFLVVRLVQQDWVWAALWAAGAALVAAELVRRLRERSGEGSR